MNRYSTLMHVLLALLISCELFASNPVESKTKIMSYNIRYDNPDDGLHNWKYRKENLVNLIKYFKPDILCMQEVLKHQLDFIQAQLGDYEYAGVGRDDGIDKGEYSPVFFSKEHYTLIDSGTFWLSENSNESGSMGWDAACTRICTWVKFYDKQESYYFFVFNTHYDHIGKTARYESSKLILNEINEIAGNNNIILTGDFNMTDDSREYKTLISNDKLKLSDAYYKSETSAIGLSNTYHGFDSNVNQPRIDYVFTSESYDVKSYAVLSILFDEGYASDHHPVIVEIKKRI